MTVDARSLHGRSRRWTIASAAVAVAALAGASAAVVTGQSAEDQLMELLADAPALDGSGNHLDDPLLGMSFRPFARIAPPAYADGISAVDATRPIERYLSNRIFNDTDVDLVSENGVTQWAFVWGQFIDHTMTLSDAGGDDDDNPVNDVGDFGLVPMLHDAEDPLEPAPRSLGIAHTFRSLTADGTGAGTGVAAEQINELNPFIDGLNVYGGTAARLDWLRVGPADGDPSNNQAELLLVDGYLPTTDARDGVKAPDMDVMGRLFFDMAPTVVAGDERANEHVALTAVHTLFAREHNRIVGALPDDLDEQTKFAIARRVVAATMQYITYEDFLPALGVELEPYSGYDPGVDPTVTTEFATVAFRAHSQIPGSLNAHVAADDVTDALLDRLETDGVAVTESAGGIELDMPLNVVFGNPGLVPAVGLGNIAQGLADHVQRANDHEIDNQLRTVLFQIPAPGIDDPLACLDEAMIDYCFVKVNDLGALDVFRTHDHGIASYNDLREALGLARATSFTDITGDDTDELPEGLTVDDPAILDVVSFVGDPPVSAVRRSTLAARLAGVFGDVDRVDAFTGMVSEPHVPGTEFGELQLALWTRQFAASRDGDRFFYGNDPALDLIAELYGIDHRRTLADVIADNTDVDRGDLADTAFLVDR